MKIRFFHTPKPRQFNYRPVYYDPKKEEFEKFKKEHSLSSEELSDDNKKLLEYYEKRIAELEEERKAKKNRSFFGSKKIRKFNYQPRFQNQGNNNLSAETETTKSSENKTEATQKEPLTIRRSMYYDNKTFIEAFKYSKILIYIILAILLCIWIFW